MGISRILGVSAFALVLILILSPAYADVSASNSKSWSRVEAGQDALFSIDQEGIPITEIKFTLKSMAENAEIELNVLSSNDTLIENPAPGEVYEYIRLIPTYIQTSNLERASIRFRVADSWISDTPIDENTISLYRYETSWSKLDTTLLEALSEDEDYTYYETPVEKLSMFAISGEKGEAQLLCTPNEKKCITNDLYQCFSDGMVWEIQENCTYGCEVGACREEPTCPECPAAGEASCIPGEQKCSGNDLQICNSDGTGWKFDSDCPGGCILCIEEVPEANANDLYMAIIICQVVIGILIVVVITLSVYLKLHK